MSKRQQSRHERAARIAPDGAILPAVLVRTAAAAAMLALAAFAVYSPAVNGGFLFDDVSLLTENDVVRSPHGLYYFWCTTNTTDYWPATNSTLWMEWRLWSKSPAGYHATNILLHIAEAVLVWVILRKLSIPGAFFAAMVFALHPVNVESVAWISSRKNLVAMLFFLLTILWYSKYTQNHGEARLFPAGQGFSSLFRHPSSLIAPNSSFILHPSSFSPWYYLSLAAFLLAMLGKGSAAILPLLLLGTTWWLRPVTRWDLVRSAPFFAVAALLAAANVWFQTHGSGQTVREAGFVERLLGAGGAIWFYLHSAVMPVKLIFVYPQWHVDVSNPLWWLPLAAVLIVTAIFWRCRKSWGRPVLFAWGFFCVSLAPALGFVDVGFMQYSLVADRYQHVAVIGVIALAAAAWGGWRARLQGAKHQAAAVLAIAAATCLAVLSWTQSGIYRDAITLYSAVLQKNPKCAMAHNNLGYVLERAGDNNGAVDHYTEALALRRDFPDYHYNLAHVLAKTGNTRKAIEHYRRAVDLKPDYVEARNNLGVALFDSGRTQDAIAEYRQVLKIRPDHAETQNNLGLALMRMNEHGKAIEHYKAALRLRPDYAETHNNLANAYTMTGRYEEAIEQYQAALTLRPDYLEARYKLANVLKALGRYPEAIESYQAALRIKPDYLDALNNLGNALFAAGRTPEAIEAYSAALRLKPDRPEVHFNLAVALHPSGRSREAIEHCRKALELALSQGQTSLAAQIENWLNAHHAEKPDEKPQP